MAKTDSWKEKDNGGNAMRAKVFVSYSWSSEEHKEKVTHLVDLLKENDIQVVWDVDNLKPGHNVRAFMERTVNDPEITRVLMICDEGYKQKADSFIGGVGEETTIIRPRIYTNTEQEKYIPVVFQCDEQGNPFLPEFVSSTLYIDMSNNEKWTDGFSKLVWCIKNVDSSEKVASSPPVRFSGKGTKSKSNGGKAAWTVGAVIAGATLIIAFLQLTLDIFNLGYGIMSQQASTSPIPVSSSGKQSASHIADGNGVTEDILEVTKMNSDWQNAKQRYNSGKYEEAIPYYTALINAYPQHYEAYLDRGTCYYNLGSYDQAVSDCTSALELHPSYHFAYNNRGYIKQHGLDDLTGAVNDYSSAIALENSDAQYYYNRGTAYMGMEDFDNALNDFNKSLEIDPNYADSIRAHEECLTRMT